MKLLDIKTTALAATALEDLNQQARSGLQFLILHFEQLRLGLEPLQKSDVQSLVTLDLQLCDPWVSLRLLSNGIDALRLGQLETSKLAPSLSDELAAFYAIQINKLLHWELCFLSSSYLEKGALALYSKEKKSIIYPHLFIHALLEKPSIENTIILDLNGLLDDDFAMPKQPMVLIGRTSNVFSEYEVAAQEEDWEDLPPVAFELRIPPIPSYKKTFSFQKIDAPYEDSDPRTGHFFDLRNLLELDYKRIPLKIKVLVFPLVLLLLGLGILSLFVLFRRPILLTISFLLIFSGLKLLQQTALYYNRTPKSKIDYKGAVRGFNARNKIELDYIPEASQGWKERIANLFNESQVMNFVIKDMMQYEEQDLTICVATIQSKNKKTKSAKSFLYWKMDANYGNSFYANKGEIRQWFKEKIEVDWAQMMDLEHVQLYLNQDELLLLFPFAFKSPKTGQALLKLFADWLLPDLRISIEKEPLFLLNFDLKSDRLCLFQRGIGDPVRGVDIANVEAIHSEGAVGVSSLQKQLRFLQGSDGQLSFKNGTWFNVRSGKVVSIFFSPRFWEQYVDLYADNFVLYFGEPDLSTDDGSTDKAAKNDYHYYKERDVTLIISRATKKVYKIAFGYRP